MKYKATIWAGDTESPSEDYVPMVFSGEFDSKDEAFDSITTYFNSLDTITKIKEVYRTDIFTCSVAFMNPTTHNWQEISRAIEVL